MAIQLVNCWLIDMDIDRLVDRKFNGYLHLLVMGTAKITDRYPMVNNG